MHDANKKQLLADIAPLVWAVVVGVVIGGGLPAAAAFKPVQVTATGVIIDVDSSLTLDADNDGQPDFRDNDPFTVTIVTDPNVADTDPTAGVASYPGAVTRMTIDLNGGAYIADLLGAGDIVVSIPFNDVVEFEMQLGDLTGPVPADIGARSFEEAVVSFVGPGFVPSEAIPGAFDNLMGAGLRSLYFDFDLNQRVAGSVTGVDVETIPEPGTAVLLGLGAVLLLRRR